MTEPALDDYWRRDKLHFSPIADRISRQWFRDIQRYVHFEANQHLPKCGECTYDRLGKVRSVMEMVQGKLLELYMPKAWFTI